MGEANNLFLAPNNQDLLSMKIHYVVLVMTKQSEVLSPNLIVKSNDLQFDYLIGLKDYNTLQ